MIPLIPIALGIGVGVLALSLLENKDKNNGQQSSSNGVGSDGDNHRDQQNPLHLQHHGKGVNDEVSTIEENGDVRRPSDNRDGFCEEPSPATEPSSNEEMRTNDEN